MLIGLCTWYMGCLNAFPLYTKSLTSAIISLLGDGGAQYHEDRIRAKEIGSHNNVKRFNYNRRRGLTNFADSALICGPMLHYGYDWLESAIPVVNSCSSSSALCAWSASHAAAAHVLIDDFIFDAIFIAIMFISTGIGEGYYMNQIVTQCKKDYFPTVKTMWKTSFLLMPLEFCLFRFLPLSLRVLGINMMDIIWDAIVSYMIHKRRKADTDEALKLVAI
mmetsp:Transcript_25755/g.46463  ORF Transcript_25755/g.46463 Transcript_25755/m.46463 type:complete len:220 (-) Transcript_25755:111-770(-)|eukprot:CAMPEP_0201941104 /NCGR_PEP_ID=MMETSP0903-20130614/46509_1 /ASSEMBLY_ACC=CAM_ASM_000552 /TAXON_ID=420261 /ORGANISM="Thalassiosira antarctica, Strain CCMP982" /LENGTH=219 /DNA_ID=CAMNT_0048483075 /DNA_START=88 /DNA_END=747 /DNA_ORIENTATION=-